MCIGIGNRLPVITLVGCLTGYTETLTMRLLRYLPKNVFKSPKMAADQNMPELISQLPDLEQSDNQY